MRKLLLILLIPLLLGFVLTLLIASEISGNSLSTSIPRTYTTPLWQCEVTCTCYVPSQWSEFWFDEIGTTLGKATFCSSENPNGLETTEETVEQSLLAGSGSNCNTSCKTAFPNNAQVKGGLKEGSARNCREIGICPMLEPVMTISDTITPFADNPF